MQISDVIADMLTRIRNANDAKHETVDIPASNMKKAIADILLAEGYIKSVQVIEDGKQGGTINDIAIHGLDAIEYMTGHAITELTAARTWNAFADQAPKFMDAAQIMFALDNHCGVIADVSYFAPEKCGFNNPFYWRFTIWGRKGVMEFNYFDDGVKLCLSGAKEPEFIEPARGKSDYLTIFMNEIAGKEEPFGGKHIMDITEKTLLLQRKADRQ